MSVLSTMLKLLFALAVGYGFRKKRLFSKGAAKSFSALILYVSSPALILHAVAKPEEGQSSGVLSFLLLGAGIYLVLLFLVPLLTTLLRIEKTKRDAARALLLFANSSFMALPVCQSFYGDSSVLYISVMMLPFNLLFFTYGIYLLQSKDPERRRTGVTFEWKRLFNPGLISAVAALLFYCLRIPVPGVLDQSLEFIAGVTMPLSMVAIGATMAEYPLLEIFKMKSLYALSFCRLLLLPFLVRLSFFFLPDFGTRMPVMVTLFAMPSASMVVMAATELDSNTEYCSAGVVLTTLLSVLTIPAVTLFLRFF